MRFTLVPGAAVDVIRPDAPGVTLTGQSTRVYTLGPEPLGSGAQAEVWPAVGDDGVPVAIKVSHATPGSVEAVRQEAELLTAIAAAGLAVAVPCLDRVEWGARTGIVLPLYDGDADAFVARLVAAAPDTAIERVLEVAARIARSLAALHAIDLPDGRVVHRDVKPENILFGSDGDLRLADFGGSLVVDGPGSIALGVFGSPMWAPFDQMLPGLPEPNPTWDTYACCVMLFWWITGGRPAYQSDPSPMLTPAGRDIWDALRAFGETEAPPDLRAAMVRLARAREGTRAAALVDVRGHGAIQPEDVAALAAGVGRLADATIYGAEALQRASRSLADLLARGLSPLAHPSPPNRYWRAADLAEEIEAIAGALAQARTALAEARSTDAERTGLREEVRKLEATARRRPIAPWIAAGVAGVAVVASLACAGFSLLRGVTPAADAVTGASVEGEPVDEVVRVEAGSFVAGDTFGDGEDDERPTRVVTLPAFVIQRTEVSNGEYQRCVDARVCTPLAGGGGEPTLPAVGVTYTQATLWCAWRGGRLPTEDEWERAAATGPATDAKRRWPWGDAAPDCAHAAYGDCGLTGPVPVEGFAAGASGWGALQMVGNVWEWTSSPYVVFKRDFFRRVRVEHRVLRGGAWNSNVASMRPTYRRHADPDKVSDVQGFRCVFAAP